MEITARNTNDLSPKVYALLDQHGTNESSRNGTVLRFDGPVTICLTHPWERVNMCPIRDANPFFHVLESVAMLANWNSVRFMEFFAKNMAEYSDDGRTYNAFYGSRARSTFSLDQLTAVVDTLRRDPTSRQAVISLWEPRDLIRSTKDKACNLFLIFAVRGGVLEMTTFNRSNDAIWGGVSGANVVHLSFFHEYVACALGLPMGRWWHTSANLHAYTGNPKLESLLLDGRFCHASPATAWYPAGPTVPLFAEACEKDFDKYAMTLCQVIEFIIRTELSHAYAITRVNDAMRNCPLSQTFLHSVAVPMFLAWHARKTDGGNATAMVPAHLNAIMDGAWHAAALAWVARRAPAAAPEVPHV